MLFLSLLLAENLECSNRKLSGFYTVDTHQDFKSPHMFPCHIIRVVNGHIIIHQTQSIHPLLKILHICIKGIDISQTEPQATEFIKNMLVNGNKVLYLNPQWGSGHGQIVADVYIDDQSMAQLLIKQGLAKKYLDTKK